MGAAFDRRVGVGRGELQVTPGSSPLSVVKGGQMLLINPEEAHLCATGAASGAPRCVQGVQRAPLDVRVLPRDGPLERVLALKERTSEVAHQASVVHVSHGTQAYPENWVGQSFRFQANATLVGSLETRLWRVG